MQKAAMIVFTVGFAIIALLYAWGVINGPAAVFLSLILIIAAAGLRAGRELPYRELTDIIK
jgi:hypothetical protein